MCTHLFGWAVQPFDGLRATLAGGFWGRTLADTIQERLTCWATGRDHMRHRGSNGAPLSRLLTNSLDKELCLGAQWTCTGTHPTLMHLDNLCKLILENLLTVNRAESQERAGAEQGTMGPGRWSGSMCSAEAESRQMKSWGRRKASNLVKNKKGGLSPLPEKAQDFQMVWTPLGHKMLHKESQSGP